MLETHAGVDIDSATLSAYFRNLVNQFFKILPIRESGEVTLPAYLDSLQKELIGCQHFFTVLDRDASCVTMISILQYLIDHPDCEVREVKREVFKAIGICNKLADSCKEAAS